ncbi:MAG: ThuA domain-containing protein [Planctomycetes bacterium]|nr:ThuA domain-containing protein [Planctomycetota bacterium]
MPRVAAFTLAALLVGGLAAGQDVLIPRNQAQQIEQAVPAKPRAAPRKPHRVLIWNTPDHLLEKDPHKGYCTPYGNHAMKTLGTKTGAFEPVASSDVSVFLPDNIRPFDGIILNNACGDWIVPSEEALKKMAGHGDRAAVEALLRRGFSEWLANGGGVAAYHYALGANRSWPEFARMMGARLGGHPWNEEVGVQVEEPAHPLVAAFEGRGFRFHDELFQFADPYDRSKVRVLLSIDPAVTNMQPKNYTLRADKDFPMAYVAGVGKGRVFYTVFGHRTETYKDARMLQFYLDGIQFALGDLEARADPRPSGACAPLRAPAGPPAAAKP